MHVIGYGLARKHHCGGVGVVRSWSRMEDSGRHARPSSAMFGLLSNKCQPRLCARPSPYAGHRTHTFRKRRTCVNVFVLGDGSVVDLCRSKNWGRAAHGPCRFLARRRTEFPVPPGDSQSPRPELPPPTKSGNGLAGPLGVSLGVHSCEGGGFVIPRTSPSIRSRWRDTCAPRG